MKLTCFLLFVMLLFNSNSGTAQSATDLDGKSYLIELTRTSGPKKRGYKKDTLKFDSGKLVSVGLLDMERFEKGDYHPKIDDSGSVRIISFNYKEKNWGGSTLQIQGTAQKDLIEGTHIWTSRAGKRVFSFEGVLI